MPLMAEEKETIALISVNPSKNRKSKILYHFEKLHMLLCVRVFFSLAIGNIIGSPIWKLIFMVMQSPA